MTFPVALEDHASSANFPMTGEPMKLSSMLSSNKPKEAEEKLPNIDYTNYEEGIYVGYRHFDKAGLEVSYPFGYGLSYTDFAFESMEVVLEDDMVHLNVSVTNMGDVAGKEVVEIYVSKPGSTIDRPVQELKAFAKTPLLNGGETVELEMEIPVSDLSYWNEAQAGWKLEEGPVPYARGDLQLNLLLVFEHPRLSAGQTGKMPVASCTPAVGTRIKHGYADGNQPAP